MSTGGGKDATEAARINTELSQRYAAVGLPAIRGGLGYATSMLDEPLPRYAEAAYRGAGTTALENNIARRNTARGQLMERLGAAGGGGAALRGEAGIESGAGRDLAQEIGAIGTSRALAKIGERNKLLSILSGGGASGTDLSAGFGSLQNQGLGLLGSDPGAYPYIVGGLSVGATALEKFLKPKDQTFTWTG